jgi:hypothetical protein
MNQPLVRYFEDTPRDRLADTKSHAPSIKCVIAVKELLSQDFPDPLPSVGYVAASVSRVVCDVPSYVFKWPNLFSEPTSLSLFETYASTGRKGM